MYTLHAEIPTDINNVKVILQKKDSKMIESLIEVELAKWSWSEIVEEACEGHNDLEVIDTDGNVMESDVLSISELLELQYRNELSRLEAKGTIITLKDGSKALWV